MIAYEPVWAIGTGKTATPEIAADAHRAIREQVREKFGKDAADAIRILYGGSVKPDNVKILMAQPEIDGVLVGGAAWTPDRSPRSSTSKLYAVRSAPSFIPPAPGRSASPLRQRAGAPAVHCPRLGAGEPVDARRG